MNILLGLTGSVATTLYEKIIFELEKIGEVKVVLTKPATYFVDISKIKNVYVDEDEWKWQKKGDPILHIDLKQWANVLVIAPLSANTLAKISNGLCDNLLTSIFRAWDWYKPIVLAPSMNTAMFEKYITHKQLYELGPNTNILMPQEKVLACGDFGTGAMAQIEEIVDKTKNETKWHFPLKNCNLIPRGNHPGAFGSIRKHDIHSGVDLYTKDKEPVYAVENGVVKSIYDFTGSSVGSPWWENTKAIAIEGSTGIVIYGEININGSIYINEKIRKGQLIGFVKRVLPFGKERPDIPGHSLSMLHISVVDRKTALNKNNGYDDAWELGQPKPTNFIDPTNCLISAKE